MMPLVSVLEKNEYLFLVDELNRHSKLYYVDNYPEISDRKFDTLYKRVESIEIEHPDWVVSYSPTKRVGGEIIDKFNSVKHNIPMKSIDNVFNESELEHYINSVYKELGIKGIKFITEPKIDGLSVSLKYKNGILVDAVTRGDGEKGDRILHNVKLIKSIPLKLSTIFIELPEELEVRGEIYMSFGEFNRINKLREKKGLDLFANPRNTAAGAMKHKNSSENKNIRLDAFMYQIVTPIKGINSQFEMLELLNKLGFPVVDASIALGFSSELIMDTLPALQKQKDFWEVERNVLTYPIDGIVIKVDNLDFQKQLGATSHHVKWAIAYKFEAEVVETKLMSVTVQVGRTGALTPVAELYPVELSGSTVKRATLHNYDNIKLLGVKIGDMVKVHKAGEIIPEIIGVVKTYKDSKEIEEPVECPYCKGDAKRIDAIVYCTNSKCGQQIKERIEYFVSKKVMNIECLGEAIISQLVDNNLIENPFDLYKLTETDLLSLDRMGKKSSKKIIENINKSREISVSRLLNAIDIPGVGKTMSEKLIEEFGSIDALSNADEQTLLNIEDIGPKTVKNILRFFNCNRDIVEKLKTMGFNTSMVNKKNNTGNKFNGLIFCVTGKLQKYTRDQIHEIIKEEGGKTSDSVSSKVNILVVGQDAGSKLEKATKLGIKIINEDEFENM